MNTPYKRRFGDRKEGRRLRTLSPFYAITPYIMKERVDASNYFCESIELSAAEAYIKKKRADGFKSFGMLHLFVAAYVRTVSQRPALNRFVSGRRIYARHKIEVVMTIKKKLSSDSGETSFKVLFDPTDTANEVYERMNAAIAKIKADDGSNKTENTAKLLMKLPRFLLRFAVCFINWMDFHGTCPQKLLEASPFHGSLVITDLGSLSIQPIYHHLYNFGNIPIFLAFGAKRRSYELNADGSVAERKYIDFNIVCDERICDGYYYSTGFKYLKYFLKNPSELNDPPEKVVPDIE